MTLALFGLPILFMIGGFLFAPLFLPAALLLAIYLWVWTRFRPSVFIVYPDRLEIRWPLRRREIRRSDISDMQVLTRQTLRNNVGRHFRIGAGGLWGAFGWLWTERRGIVQLYISRLDDLVWIECRGKRPWLITPEMPNLFIETLRARRPHESLSRQ